MLQTLRLLCIDFTFGFADLFMYLFYVILT